MTEHLNRAESIARAFREQAKAARIAAGWRKSQAAGELRRVGYPTNLETAGQVESGRIPATFDVILTYRALFGADAIDLPGITIHDDKETR